MANPLLDIAYANGFFKHKKYPLARKMKRQANCRLLRLIPAAVLIRTVGSGSTENRNFFFSANYIHKIR
jgi:hypothetical protein